jgi:hypothetical protein
MSSQVYSDRNPPPIEDEGLVPDDAVYDGVFDDGVFEFHPLANIFPLMSKEEFAALVEDIRKHGLKHPIIKHPAPDNKIIDGRNRLNACREAGVPTRFEDFKGGNVVAFIATENLHVVTSALPSGRWPPPGSRPRRRARNGARSSRHRRLKNPLQICIALMRWCTDSEAVEGQAIVFAWPGPSDGAGEWP